MDREIDAIEEDCPRGFPLLQEELLDHYADLDMRGEHAVPKQIEHPSTFIQDQQDQPSFSLDIFLNLQSPESLIELSTEKLFGEEEDEEEDSPKETSQANQVESQKSKKGKKIEKKKDKKTKKKAKSESKNFLPIMKKLIAKCYQKYRGKPDDEVFKQIAGEKTNRRDFEAMFKRNDLKAFLGRLFMEKSLHRELQYSRIDSGNRILFIRKIKLLAKGFTMEMLPNL